MQANFVDTVLNIAVTGTLVRIDIGVFTPVQREGEQNQGVRATVTQQLVMPLEGFLRSFGMQEQVIKKLIADGVLQAKPESDAVSAKAKAVSTGSTSAQ